MVFHDRASTGVHDGSIPDTIVIDAFPKIRREHDVLSTGISKS
jgi:hypothetical protein